MPAWTARVATRRFLTPPAPRPVAVAAREIFARAADQFFVDAEVPWGGGREPTRARLTLWGRGPAIYLLHGWGGRASQFASLVEPLAGAGFTVVALDAPGHGDAPAGNTSIIHFAAALRAAVDSFGPARCVVGHSLGGAAVAYALQEGLAADGVVLMGTPHTPGSTFGHFLARIGIDARLHQRVTDEAERQFGFRFGDLVVRAPADRPPPPALLVHDRDDREFDFDNALQIAQHWPNAKLIATSGLGHYRILRDEAVAEGIRAFARMPSAFTVG
jgi:pimeloyl-ACP methyl ester carboxylesterase